MPSIYRNGIRYSSNGGLESAAIIAGVIVPYAGNTAPVGWLLCDGSTVSRTTYSVLFDVIGTTYGSGDGSTTFNLPDLTGRFPLGLGTGDASDATAHTLGQKAGTEKVTLTENEIPSHTHGNKSLTGTMNFRGNDGSVIMSSDGIITKNSVSWSGSHSNVSLTTATNPTYNTATVNASHEHNSFGGDQAHNNMPPYTAVNYIISIGAQNGGFTHIEYDSTEDEYLGGIEDKYLLTDNTISNLASAGITDNDSGNIDQTINYVANHWHGADKSKMINYGAVSSVTPSRDGWLVVGAVNSSAQTTMPVVRILDDGNVIAEATGLTNNSSAMYASAYVQGGRTYTITVYRTVINSVILY